MVDRAVRLVVVESPKKARTIRGFLGAGYQVVASMGHVRDLPPKALGVDVAGDFAPEYVVLPRAQSTLTSLRKAASGAEAVLLATDPDREGEAIAWHLAQALRLPKSRYRRITFHEISRRAIQEALAHPRDLDPHLIDAQQARRVLDRLVGYQLSPLLWRKVQRGTSAGRVQSVAVRLVVDREREILAFVPQEYWTIDVRLSTEPDAGEDECFLARLQEVDGKKAEVPNAETAERLKAQLEEAAYRVREVVQKTVSRNPFPPFTTSTLQQAAGNRLRFPSKKTMTLAQELYEAGLITYMRTDSVAISSAAIAQVRRQVEAEFGADYLPPSPRRYATRAKNAQEAHEAIRPVDPAKTPAALRSSLSPDEWRVYELIWKRTLASQMAPARYHQRTAFVDGVWAGEQVRRFLLRATASTLVFPGWLKVYGEDGGAGERNEDDAPNDALPDLDAGQVLYEEEVLPAQHFTQPPRRFTEPALVKALEDAGVGRPSTYAAVVSTIQDRGYVRLEQRHFLPTELGFAASDFLVTHFPDIVDLPFTAGMEDSLDEIAGGRLGWTEMLRTFYGPFSQTVSKAAGAPVSALKQTEPPGSSTGLPPLSPSLSPLVGERGSAGRTTSRTAGRSRTAKAAISGTAAPRRRTPRPPSVGEGAGGRGDAGPCPQCGKPLVERTSQYGPFFGCSGFPACRYVLRTGAGATSETRPVARAQRRRAPAAATAAGLDLGTKRVVRSRNTPRPAPAKRATAAKRSSPTRRSSPSLRSDAAWADAPAVHDSGLSESELPF
ncbi:MAG: DNA topoisomerase I [uncultured Chloroflexi bacterium]|uniref:DNA topoisomerase 1 n=1 Tax=uncultured Chloroflexota bacterium TaxID=166587 RepID=A0A6J4HQ92_9CHLR|nr:MAG: DNA topoisomerase I [uncultured Chloroflexota bacterium]